jgi:hypothetical protein
MGRSSVIEFVQYITIGLISEILYNLKARGYSHWPYGHQRAYSPDVGPRSQIYIPSFLLS